MAKLDPDVFAHLEWIGFVRPTGLVVSAPALVRAGAILDRRDALGQHLLNSRIEQRVFDPDEGEAPFLPDFRAFATTVLGWSFSPAGYAGTPESPIPPDLEVILQEYGETLRPDYAVLERDANEGESQWQVLVRVLEPGEAMDHVTRGGGGLEASAHGRMERLLRQTGAPAGLLFNGRVLRLVSAPRGESSGWIDFRVADMSQVAGRPISTAMRLLLNERRLLALPRAQRLAALLDDSRRFQNEVSERLAEQVLHALYELLRGFQSAHDASKGELLRQPLAQHPDEVYRALLTVILRLVFLLYAEERDMLPEDETYLRHYSLGGLYERLREDAAFFPDTMDQRFGAWAQLLVLFRLVHDGADAGELRLPQRHGVLFDPDRFRFLEGRSGGGSRQVDERIEPPLVPDGTIYRALEKLLVLSGERISYRALDVEQIGSVYETMMGFRLQTAEGRSIAIKAAKRGGPPTTVDLDALIKEIPAKREKWVQERADRKLTDTVRKAIAAAGNLDDLHAALEPIIDYAATPDTVLAGHMVLQPSDERRRSGSHYTPRALTEPIVRTTVAPILEQLRGPEGESPTPAAILELKICDPAMGSGAFLVESCRQLGDALVEAWRAHDLVPVIPPDEDEVVFARRLVAQRCLYGVDKNPVAVDLAKVSLWLVTLARDHPLTFVDHALRHGDSLVGLARKQIEAFHWDPDAPRFQAGFETMRVREHIEKVAELRRQIREADEDVPDTELHDVWAAAESELEQTRIFGDLVVAAFFEGKKPKEREAARIAYAGAIVADDDERYRDFLHDWRHGELSLAPFHWEIEFAEVFERENPGFDAIVGNPPFLGGRRVRSNLGDAYCDWLPQAFELFSNNADLVAAFFRRSFDLIRIGGCFGLIATNTIAQGDTRRSGLAWIREHKACIFSCTRRLKWPGSASVTVSVVHVTKGRVLPSVLDGEDVPNLTAFLFHAGGDRDPGVLLANSDRSFQGVVVAGSGFVFDDSNRESSPTALARELVERDQRNLEIIRPYIGGEEINSSPTLAFSRWVIDFSSYNEQEAAQWPDLMKLVEEKVLPYRQTVRRDAHRRYWWQFGDKRPALRSHVAQHDRVLVGAQVSQHFAFAFQPTDRVFAMMLNVFIVDSFAAFCAMQSQVHEIWARFFGSSLEDRLRYTPSDCFETFPFPEDWETHVPLEEAGRQYYEFRSRLMIANDEGLTKTYNRFHDPEERDQEIVRLRELHGAVDRAVLDAYGWTDVPIGCEFLLDYEVEDDWGNKKKPWRYRWPDYVRDDVLARLLERNAVLCAEEVTAGAAAGASGKKRLARPAAEQTGTQRLFS